MPGGAIVTRTRTKGFGALEVLLLVGLAGAIALGSYATGSKHKDNEWKAKEATRLKSEAMAREAEIKRGDKASGQLQAELLGLAISNEQLTKAFNDLQKRNQILARRPVAPAPSTAAATAGAAPIGIAVTVGAEPSISHGAVWMWNSALAGRDVPSGSCGLADATEESCAADSGIALDQAWANQALNAKLCAEDRLRYRRLIDFVKGKPQ
jgi:type II secretory pathway pseudopilin PulG